MYRIKKAELRYKKKQINNTNKCDFCDPSAIAIISQTENFYIIKNIFPYNIWDRRKVKTHLLVASKGHLRGLEEISAKLLKEYITILKNYSGEGFDMFTRSTESVIKTVEHFHTHLIKTYGKKLEEVNFTADPYELNFK